MFLTRDKENNDLTLWFNKPRRSYTFWKSDNGEVGILLEGEEFDKFKYLKWEDDPLEIEFVTKHNNDEEVIEDFSKTLLKDMRPMDADFAQCLNEHFWELV